VYVERQQLLNIPLTKRTVAILNVHGIGPVDRKLEPGEHRTWVTVDQFEEVVEAVADRPDVLLTFDDGNMSDIEVALPRLVKAGLRAEFFVCAGLFGRPGRLDADGLRELLAAGMSVGSHGWLHRDWRKIDEAEAREEIAEAHRVIGEIVGAPVTTVAIPFGSYDRQVLRRLRAAHVRRVYTSDGGRARSDAWLQPRNSLREDMDHAWLSHTLGTVPLMRRARNAAARTAKRWRR
jgi:peptidoglycan/xylan/chitin deacetylase (PgdA/CDA1 family)